MYDKRIAPHAKNLGDRPYSRMESMHLNVRASKDNLHISLFIVTLC